MKRENFNVPNCITALRIVGTAFLLFVEPLSSLFFIIYTLTGFTDVLDGWIARSTNKTSELGAKLDSVADLLFYAVMLIRILPILISLLPKKIWIAVGIIIAMRIFSYTLAAIKYHRFASMHTWMNKVTGGAIFTVPYILKLPFAIPLCWAVCAIAGIATLEELLIHIISKEYSVENKTIFRKGIAK